MQIDDLTRIGEFLVEDGGTVPSDTGLWDRADEARMRSAVNRAYYGVFLYLKYRMVPKRLPKDWFPKRGVHARLKTALRKTLGWNHPLTQLVMGLARHRGDADYSLSPGLTERAVLNRIDESDDALVEAQNLTEDQWQDLADALATS